MTVVERYKAGQPVDLDDLVSEMLSRQEPIKVKLPDAPAQLLAVISAELEEDTEDFDWTTEDLAGMLWKEDDEYPYRKDKD